METMEVEDRIALWHKSFQQGTDHDLWGQPVEAINCYRRLARDIRIWAPSEMFCLHDKQKKWLYKIASCLELRSTYLQERGKSEPISLDDLMKVSLILQDILTKCSGSFPLDISPFYPSSHVACNYQLLHLSNSGCLTTSECSEDFFEENNNFNGSLLPPPTCLPGDTMVTVHIDRIGLKDVSAYLDCFITVSLKDGNGIDISPPQDTPLATFKEDPYIFFGVDVFIQKSFQSLPIGCAVVFEFKHYKPRKQKTSVLCWSFIEQDEMEAEGPRIVELYRKPTDSRRKKIRLLTVKPLYLHLKVVRS